MSVTLRAIRGINLAGRVAGTLRSPPPLWVLAATLVGGEAICALIGVHSLALSGLALLAPGFALAPLLPERVRGSRLASLAAAPALGMAVSIAVLVTLARAGIPLTQVSIRVALIAIVALATLAWSPHRSALPRPSRADALELLALLGVVALGLVLAFQVIGGSLVPGNDWAKYLLYANEVSRHGTLLIKNPYWLLGVPFRDDPGAPALYGSALVMSRAAAGELSHAIVVFAVLEVTSAYAFARAFWGRFAGILAAALVALVPASQDILGWEGVANLAALVLLGLLFCYLASYARGELDWRAKLGFAATLLGLLAAHRLSGLMGVALTGLVVLVCLLSAHQRGRALRDAIGVALLTLVLGAGVLADLIARERTFGGSLPYTDYLTTKLIVGPAISGLSPELVGATLGALIVIAWRHRAERELWPALGLLLITLVLAFAWIVHVPNYYERMVYYLPLLAAPLVAAVVVRLPRPRVTGLACLAGIAAITVSAFQQAPTVKSFYSFATPASLRGLDALAAVLRPNEVVVTDRCWSFVATWLLHTRTLAAMENADIQPKAELPLAEEARDILWWNARGQKLAHQLGVRYLITDPACPRAQGGFIKAPTRSKAKPVFESQTLAILRLPSGG
ncbi:MAG: hypothetical protein ABSC56_01600 [Solirubrobacteraceae bacterium]|jgi:hypothetical protein